MTRLECVRCASGCRQQGVVAGQEQEEAAVPVAWDRYLAKSICGRLKLRLAHRRVVVEAAEVVAALAVAVPDQVQRLPKAII